MKGDAWRQIILLILLLMAFNFLYITLSPPAPNQSASISYSRFRSELSRDNIREVVIQGNLLHGSFRNETQVAVDGSADVPSIYTKFSTLLPPFQDMELLYELETRGVEIVVEKEKEASSWATVLVYLIPWVIILAVWFFVLRGLRGKGGPGGGIMGGFSKSGARMYTRETSHVTFDDVAGLDEAKQELLEIVDFLRDPKKFTRIGGKVPRGVLLVGPPGTGKTLMARAVAGEAGVPFFSISASQFIEMFVGVGASRVRDLFTNARKSAPSIIFIDELDAVGRSRGTGLGGGNDEREQTLNQLLAELDGFDPHEEVVVMSATNRPDVLDTALLRPGRFDRQVVLDRPDWRARLGILKVHVRKVPLSDDVDLEVIARSTPGMCGAELENLVNESALIAARNDLDKVSMRHFEAAKDKVMMGAERKLLLTDEEKRITAYHEAGHTLVAKFLPGSDPIHKVTIIPHGQALGVTQQLPDNDRYHYSRQALMVRIAVAMGGRAAEMEVFGDLSTGAQNDLKQVTDLAEKMVCQWGMSEKVGPVTFSRGEEHPFLGRKLAAEKTFSERMAWVIDQEIERIVTEGAQRATDIVRKERGGLDRLAKALLEEEVLEGKRVDEVLALLDSPAEGGQA